MNPLKNFLTLGLILGAALSLNFQARAQQVGTQKTAQRIVNSEEEKIRLQGWDEHQRTKAKFDRERLNDRRDTSKEDREWQKLKDDDLVYYRREKARRQKEIDDSGAEYKKDLAEKQKQEKKFQEQLDQFLEIRRRVREKSKSTVKLTEEEELGLFENRDRFEWEKRNLLDPKGLGSGSRRTAPPRASSPPIPSVFDSGPPPPPASTPDFELDVPPPPPPPPPPVPEFSEGMGDVPPPPPASGFEEQVPPPIFEEDF